MVGAALEGWNLNELDFLFIENVGNLVCPSSYDLGENARAVLLSVTIPVTSTNLFNDLRVPTLVHSPECSDFCSDPLTLLQCYSANDPFCPEFLELLHRRFFLFCCRVNVPHGHQNTRVS